MTHVYDCPRTANNTNCTDVLSLEAHDASMDILYDVFSAVLSCPPVHQHVLLPQHVLLHHICFFTNICHITNIYNFINIFYFAKLCQATIWFQDPKMVISRAPRHSHGLIFAILLICMYTRDTGLVLAPPLPITLPLATREKKQHDHF